MLFNMISRPEIRIDNNKAISPGSIMFENLKSFHEQTDKNILEMVLYVNELKSKTNIDDIDLRLMNFLDDDMKKYLEN